MLIIQAEKIEKLKEELAEKNTLIDVRKNILPVKQFFLPGTEEIFIYEKNKARPAKKPKPFIIFGLNLRDTEALVQLDEIMKKPNPDFFYLQKRNSASIISIIEEDGPLPHTGIDLILEKLNETKYKATALSEKGKKIIKNKFFTTKNINPALITSTKSTTMPQLRQMLLNPELLKDAVHWSWENYPEIWEKLSEQCLGCGICTYVCPLCYCFSIENNCGLNKQKCTRTRKWTACTLPEFSKIAGGHNFHPTIKERYYNWFYHKFARAYKEYGKAQCVACGQCQKYCPAKIDIEKVLIEIVEKYKNLSINE